MLLLSAPNGFSFSLSKKTNFLLPKWQPTRPSQLCIACLITSPDSFEVGRLIGSYGFMNITSFSGFQSDYSSGDDDVGRLRVQDVGEGSVKIRLYEGRIARGSFRGTPVMFKVYPGQRAGGIEADEMAANELNAHAYLQNSSKGSFQNLVTLVGGFETTTGEQWLAFRNDGKYNAADYAKFASERISKALSQKEMLWTQSEQEETINLRRYFVIKLLRGAINGLAFMHEKNRLHQSLGPSSVVIKYASRNFWFKLKCSFQSDSQNCYLFCEFDTKFCLHNSTITESGAAYLVPQLRDLAFSVDIRLPKLEDNNRGTLSEGLWRRATSAGAFSLMEKRTFGIADDIYEAGLLVAYMAFVPFCEAGIIDSLSLNRLLENTFQLDLEAMREYDIRYVSLHTTFYICILVLRQIRLKTSLTCVVLQQQYCMADDRLLECVKFLDLGNGAGWELLQAMLNPDFRKRPIAEAVLNHRFLTGAVLFGI
ncbi:hypothetical protein ACFE04_027599 [Oxalis oulophora]